MKIASNVIASFNLRKNSFAFIEKEKFVSSDYSLALAQFLRVQPMVSKLVSLTFITTVAISIELHEKMFIDLRAFIFFFLSLL